jgi:hypothetical protein
MTDAIAQHQAKKALVHSLFLDILFGLYATWLEDGNYKTFSNEAIQSLADHLFDSVSNVPESSPFYALMSDFDFICFASMGLSKIGPEDDIEIDRSWFDAL